MLALIKKITTLLGIKKGVGFFYRRCVIIYESLYRWIIKTSFNHKAIVLVYHRVAKIEEDPLSLAVTPSHFSSHLNTLRQHFEMISIVELTKRLRSGTLKGNECCITFDDGYTDNITEALPIATSFNIPIALFVSTGIFKTVTPFFWDKMYKDEPSRYLSIEQIKNIKSDLLTIGSHTIHHPRLIDGSVEYQRSEIGGAKTELEHMLNIPITYFAYPFGGYFDYSNATTREVQRTGHTAAFITSERAVTRYTNIFKIPRINIRDQSCEELMHLIHKSI